MPDSDSRPAVTLHEPLTRREREILPLLAEGLTGPEIAERLTLGISSVKTHMQHLYAKLGANSKRQAVSRARELGLLQPGIPASAPRDPAAVLARLAEAQNGRRHNLPVQLTNFIGRRREIDNCRGLLRSTRLLTLTGAGGTGKTRLALEIGAESLGDFPHGVWLVVLDSLAEPEQVPQAVAQTLGLAEGSGPLRAQALAEYLRDRALLLILDNCEHLVAACAELAEQLLRAAPNLRILATSREILDVPGETSWPVPTLSAPDTGQLPVLEALATSEAVRLFVERAQAARPDFVLTELNAPAVQQVCQRLDGIPLALELAAARTRALSVEQIAARLGERDRFGLLTGGGRSAAPRQKTLRATIDWSYELLSEVERTALRRLAVFMGGWTAEAAEQALDGPDALDLLTQLVGKSLVLSTQQPGQAARFRMLETIREYALEKLAEAGEAEAARDRHLAIHVALAEEAEPGLRGQGQANWMKRLDREGDNFRAALAWAVERNAAESMLRLAGALGYFWYMHDPFSEGRRWLETALRLAASESGLARTLWWAKALLRVGLLTEDKENALAFARNKEALELYRQQGDKPGIAEALFCVAVSCDWDSDTAFVQRRLDEALEIWTAARDGWGIGFCLHVLADRAFNLGNRVQARELYERSAAVLRDAGARWDMTHTLDDLAHLIWLDGDAARARALLAENLAAIEELGGGWGLYLSLNYRNLISTALGDFDQARAEALIIQHLPGRARNQASGLTRLGQIEYLQGHLAEAQAYFENALRIFQKIEDQNGMAWVPPWLGCVAYRAGNLQQARALIEDGLAKGEHAFFAELAFGQLARGDVARAQGEPAVAADYYGRSLGTAAKFHFQPGVAEPLEGFAKLAGAAGQPQRAARLFGAAQALRDRIGTPIPPVERADYDAARAQARAQLDEAAFAQAWAEGRATGWEEAAAFALGE